MSKKSKQARQEWEALLAGLKETAPARGTASLRSTLEGSLQEIEQSGQQRDTHAAAAAKARRKAARALARGRDAAMRVKSYLKFRLGPYNAELVRFGITPIRRGRKTLTP